MLAPADEEEVNAEFNLIDVSSTPADDPSLKVDKVKGWMVSAEWGGKVTNGHVTLEFPPGALDEDTYITMCMVNKSNLVVEFAPHGIEFNKPVTMSMKLKDTALEHCAESTVIKWYNPATDELEDITNLPPEKPSEARASLEHFSKYEAVSG
ncbi:MAG: hypothetical protein JSW50_14995 [Candidatus Latescibacterota bacterium]|nr:MAG: hypothetical protein JSW50_14995 [Candidatus Latescibacterota bacterium]